MLTYGDMITQVLCFFVILYSMSNISVDKFAKVLGSIQDAFGEGYHVPTVTQPEKAADYFEQIIKASPLRKDQEGVGASFGTASRLSYTKEGASILLGDHVLFDEFQVALKPEGQSVIREAVRQHQLAGFQNIIIVKGNTSPDESDTKIAALNGERGGLDWRPAAGAGEGAARAAMKVTVMDGRDLSYWRAKAVADLLVNDPELKMSREAIDPRRIQVRAMDKYDNADNFVSGPASQDEGRQEARTPKMRESQQRCEIIVSEVLVVRPGQR